MKRVFWITLIAVVLLVLAAVGMVARSVQRSSSSQEPSSRRWRSGRLDGRSDAPHAVLTR